ncbi:MAG: hypothetical protein KGJ37_03385 [Verrucomicrobiota bacterium]|nr:hypothetical protein [Verrucomicrobiota bacterium]
MFTRLVLQHRDAIVGITAFAVALSIFLAMVWRAMRMSGRQRAELASLPFRTDTPCHDREPASS